MADTDDPYFLDFLFNNITNVHFGDAPIFFVKGFAESSFGTGSFSAHLTCSFPQLAGGTPGYTLISGMDKRPGFQTPHVVTAKDLIAPMKTDAGAALKGFTVRNGPSPDPFKQTQVAVILPCVGLLSKKFKVRLDGSGSSSPTTFFSLSANLWKKNTVKKGTTIDLIFADGSIRPFADVSQGFSGSGTVGGADGHQIQDFIVDPAKLTVVAA